MGDVEKKKRRKKVISNQVKWISFVCVFLFALSGLTAAYFICMSNENSVEVSAKGENEVANIIEEISLEDLENVENKTEAELKELNEKEVKEAETKSKNENKKTTSTKKTEKKTSPSYSSAKTKYYIKVNYGAQVVNVYTYDKNGKYTVPVKAFVCSTGTATPASGVYKIPAKITWCHMFGDVWAHYCSQIVGNILFHSVPYLERNNHSLEYWAYDKLGTKASMGCIRLTTRDAKWIFDNVSVGTPVEFYSSSNPGPLGKPSAQKISNAKGDLKNWDPTDPDTNNPWKKYNSKNTSKDKTTSSTTNKTNSSKDKTTTNKNEVNTNSQVTPQNTTTTPSANLQNTALQSTNSQNNTNSQNTTSQSTNSQNTNSQNTASQNTNTQSSNSQNTTSQNSSNNLTTNKPNSSQTNSQANSTDNTQTNAQQNNQNNVTQDNAQNKDNTSTQNNKNERTEQKQ